MKTKRILVTLGALMFFSLFVLEGLYVKVAVAQKEPVKLGVITYRTGVAKDWGDRTLRGVELAVQQINEKGGILGGRKIAYDVYDEGYASETSVASTKKAIASGAKGLLAFQDATTAVPGILEAKKTATPLMVLTAGSPRIIMDNYWECFNPFVPPPPMPGNMITGIAVWAKARGYKRPMQVATESEWGKVCDREFKRLWGAPGSGMQFLGTMFFPYGKAEATLEITKAVAKKPDFIYFCLWGHEVVLATLKKVDELGYKGGYMINYISLYQETVDEARGAGEGAFSGYHWLPDPKIPQNVAFREAFLKFHKGIEPDGIAETAYEATYAMTLGMDRAGTDSDPRAIGDAIHFIHRTPWVTPRGVVLQVTPSGQFVIPEYPLGQIVKGKIIKVGKIPLMQIGDYLKYY